MGQGRVGTCGRCCIAGVVSVRVLIVKVGQINLGSVINSASFHTRVAVASRGRTVGVGVELSDVCLTLVCGGGLLGLLLRCCVVGVVSVLTVWAGSLRGVIVG